MTSIATEAPLLQLGLLAVSSSLSPGPNNLLIAAHAACFGVRRSVPTLLGMYAGFGSVFLVVALGAAAVSRVLPGWLPRAGHGPIPQSDTASQSVLHAAVG